MIGTSRLRGNRRRIESARDPGKLVEIMRDFRSHTIELVSDLDDQQMIGPRLPTVNPPLWEIGHIAWFQEFWVLRYLRKERPLIENGDQIYNSTDVAHDTRWELLLPSRGDTLRYMQETLARAIDRLDFGRELLPDEFYFYLLATFHEGMHAEALAYTRQTLGYPAPRFVAASEAQAQPGPGGAASCDVEIPGGVFTIGATREFPFVFDNEKWAHPVALKTFKIARAPVTNGDFLAFVENGGYREEDCWSPDGWRWLRSGRVGSLERSFSAFWNKQLEPAEDSVAAAQVDHPIYWRPSGNGRWQQRIFDRYVSLNPNLPVVHVSWYEAEAYCNWANRRLPTEAEWEVAASFEPGNNQQALSRRQFPWGEEPPTTKRANLDWSQSGVVEVSAYSSGDAALGCRQMIGNVWEWTADDFQPYPGFSADPYKEYSQPWFGTHKVLRGGCWATSSLLIRNSWRNFYTPDRRDVWAGFRTCAR